MGAERGGCNDRLTEHENNRQEPFLYRLEVQQVSEQNIKKFYETLARIISEREQVKITVSVSKKEKAA